MQRKQQKRKQARRRPVSKRTRRNRRQGVTIEQLFDMFPDERAAQTWFEELRWGPDDCDLFCPKCGSVDAYRTKGGKPQTFRCRDCKRYFNVRYDTVMEHTNLPYRTGAIASYCMATSLKGVASMKLARDLGVTQKTAWMLAHKIREGWLEATDDKKLSGVLEVDETYIGGLEKNKHWDKKLRLGRPATRGCASTSTEPSCTAAASTWTARRTPTASSRSGPRSSALTRARSTTSYLQSPVLGCQRNSTYSQSGPQLPPPRHP